MHVAITGASGMIGRALSAHLRAEGHTPVPLSRPDDWDPEHGTFDRSRLEGIDAVVHLAGVGIGDSRWTPERKRAIRESRVEGTRLVAETLASMDGGPRVLVSASAIGWYGDTGERAVDESEPAATDFLGSIVQDWERAAQPAIDAGIRVAFARSGVVLSPEGGALGKQLPFFKVGLGGKSGSGRQWLSWISIDDEVAALAFLLTHDVAGPVNLVSPEPVRNAEFARTLGAALHRPTFVIPMIGPRLLYGKELADSLLLTSQRVVPQVLEAEGFRFAHPSLDDALGHLLR
jgi:uncharacterized protein (TIGR01777 family)